MPTAQVMKSRAQWVLQSEWSNVGLITAILLLTRFPRIWSLGVYWDDWGLLLAGAQNGAWGVLQGYTAERLLMGAPHALSFAVFGPNPVAWHVANLLLELGIALFSYGVLRRLLPDPLPLLTACLFVAYPLSLIRTNMMNLHLNAAILLAVASLYLTSDALRARSEGSVRWRHVLAAALIPTYLLMYEMPIGLEVVRFCLLWATISRRLSGVSLQQRIVRLGNAYLPYAGGLFAFILARGVGGPLITQALGLNQAANLGIQSFALPGFSLDAWHPGPFKIIHVAVHTLITPWINAAWTLFRMQPSDWKWTFAWFLGATALLLTRMTILVRFNGKSIREESHVADPFWWMRLSGISLAATLLLLAPILAHPGYTVEYDTYYSRNGYLATVVAGLACLSMVGMLASGLSSISSKGFVALAGSLLVGLGASYNWHVTNEWVHEWRASQNTWRQILARIPSFRENSLVIFSRPDNLKAFDKPLRHQDIFQPAQVFYGIQNNAIAGSSVLLYMIGGDDPPIPVLPWLEKGDWPTKKTEWPIEPVGLHIDQRNILVLDEHEGCLKVLDNRRHTQEVASPLSKELSRFSNVDVIQPVSRSQETEAALASIREKLLGDAPQDWCELYARAGWLRQQQSWGELVELYRKARADGLKPVNRVEYLPFIEALARSGEFAMADELLGVLIESGSEHDRRTAAETLTNVRNDILTRQEHIDRLDHQLALLAAP
jgi:hypothetical protein